MPASGVDMASALRHALVNEELRVHYQPLICLHSQQMIGVEALVRWQHPQRGLVPPAEFIPIAEENRADRRHRRLGAGAQLPGRWSPGNRPAIR